MDKRVPLTERRSKLRFPLDLEVTFQVLRRGSPQLQGTGRLVDFSSRALAFRADTDVPLESILRVSIAWPARLQDGCALSLIVGGRVLRRNADLVVITIEYHEFRTRRRSAMLPQQIIEERPQAPADR